MDPPSGQSSSRNSLTASMATVAAGGITKDTLKPFMFSDEDKMPDLDRAKSRNSSKSVMVRRTSNGSGNIQRKNRATSLNENLWKGVNVPTPDVPEHLKPKKTQTQPGLRSMLYGLDMRLYVTLHLTKF